MEVRYNPKSDFQDCDDCYAQWPIYNGDDLGVKVDELGTHFTLWSPKAEFAEVLIYATDRNTPALRILQLQRAEDGTWRTYVPEILYGRFYTFRVTINGRRLAESPGIWAKATGTNGRRAAIIDFVQSNPEGWQHDVGPRLKSTTDAVIYELHFRDFSMHPSAGMVHQGKFLALTEFGTKSSHGLSSGIDHLKELGITHVHILPSFDFNSIDEANLAANNYNWGYDPFNYNTPEGSYSTDPANPAVRICEMKRMVKALHEAGIGVIMDVVYNHTANGDDSVFSLTAPGYYYRHKPDGSYSNASGCGNETASERAMMRNFIVNSVKYWAKEYHIDGFRFDLMGVHDTGTMNAVASELRKINPGIIIYGEGWIVGDSPLPSARRAVKENVAMLDGVAVFSDDIRDAIKGHYCDEQSRGFVSGGNGCEETIKIGVVASTPHPQVKYNKSNKSKFPYATSPRQIINYVSCHDGLNLTDKLTASMPGSTEIQRQRAARLAHTIVFTSQGIPFMFAGEELFRSKSGDANSYKSSDSVNAIDWSLKSTNYEHFAYLRELIKLRRTHPAFRMVTARDIAANIVFDDIDAPNVVSYTIGNNANGDEFKTIKLVFNGSNKSYAASIPQGCWIVIARDGRICADGLRKSRGGRMIVRPLSALIIAEK